jgi:predicted DNA-binding transcriptional regulator AlpA
MKLPPDHVPAFPSRSRVAAELDMAESTVDEMVKRGILPAPIKLSSGCVRFEWRAIEAAMLARKNGDAAGGGDPYMAGALNVLNVTQITAKERRDAS